MKLVDAFARHDRPVDLLLLPELDHSVNGYRAAVRAAFDGAVSRRALASRAGRGVKGDR